MSLVEVVDLSVSFGSPHGEVQAVDQVSFTVEAGATLGLVGESGSGKSVTALSLVGLAPPGGRVSGQRISVAGVDVLAASVGDLQGLLRHHVGLVFQNPLTALNPRLTVGEQVVEALPKSVGNRSARLERVLSLLAQVGMQDPRARLRQYPHELSGGLAQRVVIALALARDPELLIADEPTTALDARIQAQILELLDTLRQSLGLAVILISHDLAVVAQHTDRIAVMQRGRIVESGETAAVMAAPAHPYTRDLLEVIPRLEDVVGTGPRDREPARLAVPSGFPPDDVQRDVVVTASEVSKMFGGPRSARLAVDGVSLEVRAGDAVGLVGESGSGKTTLARILVGLERQSEGLVTLAPTLAERGRRRAPSAVQYVFQDSTSSLNPHLRVKDVIAEFLEFRVEGRAARYREVERLLAEVELPAQFLDRFPRQLSGGQRQRIGIARALAADPVLLVADEPVSALDVSVQATVINLLNRLRERRGLTSLIISHDIGVIAYLCNRIVVLHDGRVEEAGTTREVILSPRARYTRELLRAVPGIPDPDRRRDVARGSSRPTGAASPA